MSEDVEEEFLGLANDRLPRSESFEVPVTEYEKRRWALEADAYGVPTEEYLRSLITAGRTRIRTPRADELEEDH